MSPRPTPGRHVDPVPPPGAQRDGSSRPRVLDQVLAVASFERTRLRRGRHAIARMGLVAGPPLALAVLVALFGRGAPSTEAELPFLALAFWFFLRSVVYLATMEIFANAFRGEIADRTLHHLLLRPARREVVAAGKFLGSLAALLPVTLLTWLAVMGIVLLPHGPGAAARELLAGRGLAHLGAYLVVLVLAELCYGALFLLAGLVLRRPLHAGALLWIWEWITLLLPHSFKRFTVLHWLQSLMPLKPPSDSPLAVVASAEPVALAVVVPLAVAAAALAGAVLLARGREVAYRVTE